MAQERLWAQLEWLWSFYTLTHTGPGTWSFSSDSYTMGIWTETKQPTVPPLAGALGCSTSGLPCLPFFCGLPLPTPHPPRPALQLLGIQCHFPQHFLNFSDRPAPPYPHFWALGNTSACKIGTEGEATTQCPQWVRGNDVTVQECLRAWRKDS